jgi:hypothetical protein
MGILLYVIVAIGLIAIALRALKSYEAELRTRSGRPGGSDAIDPFLFPEVDSASSNHASVDHHSHQGGLDCGGSHHGGCDVGGHSGFDSGHGGFDSGGGHH